MAKKKQAATIDGPAAEIRVSPFSYATALTAVGLKFAQSPNGLMYRGVRVVSDKKLKWLSVEFSDDVSAKTRAEFAEILGIGKKSANCANIAAVK